MNNKLFETAASRRTALALAATGILSGCASLTRSPFFSTLANFRRPATPAIDPKKIQASPFASMQAWFTGSSKALLVLGEYQRDQRLVWYSADRQSVTTWGPFVLRLLGLDVNVRDTAFSGSWSSDLRAMVGRRAEKSVSFQSGTRIITMRTQSAFRMGASEEVIVLGQARTLRRIEEHVVADGSHRFENRYWIDDKSGFCWKSRQLVVPTMAPLNIEITKAPRGA